MGGHDEQLKTNCAWSVRCVNRVSINELRESAEHLPRD